MDDKIEAIRAAVADGASPEQKAHGAQACRAILAALGAEPGKPIVLPESTPPHPLAGLDPGQALDLLIAKLTAALPKEGAKGDEIPSARAPASPGLRIAFVAPPTRPVQPRASTRRVRR